MKIVLLFTIHQTAFEFLTQGISYGEACIYTDFPTILHTSTCPIIILLYTLSLTKQPLSFGAEPSSIRRYREYLPPQNSHLNETLIRKFSKNFCCRVAPGKIKRQTNIILKERHLSNLKTLLHLSCYAVLLSMNYIKAMLCDKNQV